MEPIKNYPKYKINRNGEIYNLRNHRMNYVLSNNGYYRVKLDGKYRLVHRIIAEQYIENPNNKITVDHINRNKIDNQIENLRWSNYTEQNKNRKNQLKRGSIIKKSKNYYLFNYRIKNIIHRKYGSYRECKINQLKYIAIQKVFGIQF